MEPHAPTRPATVLPPGTVPGIAAVPRAARSRLSSVDLLRGIVMVIMLLDHTRDFIHADIVRYDATDLTQTSPAVFFSRWITHFCAPIFVFLAGTGAYLQLSRGKSVSDLSRFLWTRGVWLIVLEFTAVRLGLTFNFGYAQFLGAAQVIWALGVSMIVLAALIRLPVRWVGAFGVAVIALHNLLDGISIPPWRGPGTPAPDLWQSLFMILHQPGPIPINGGLPVLFIMYPLLPWIGVMAAGYAFGTVYDWDAERRRRFLVRLGAAMLVAFVALRAGNFYGDPRPWSVQRDAVFSVLSFVNVTKYPVSLLFLLMTLGTAMLALAAFERARADGVAKPLITFGRVPLFYYLLQWPVSHGMGLLLSMAAGKNTAFYFAGPGPGAAPDPNFGFSLPVVYACWIAGVILLYPLCAWFAALKQRRRDWWLSYL